MESVRLALESDLGRLESLLAHAMTRTPQQRGGWLYRASERAIEPAQRLCHFLESPHHLLLCGLVDDYVVGLSLARIEDSLAAPISSIGHDDFSTTTKIGVIEELFVEPEARSVGVGEALLATT